MLGGLGDDGVKRLDDIGLDLPVKELARTDIGDGGVVGALERKDTAAWAKIAKKLARDWWVRLDWGAPPEGGSWSSVMEEGEKAWPHMRPGKIFKADGSVAEGISPSGAARGDRFVAMDDEKLNGDDSSSFDRVRGLAARLKEVGDALSGALAAEPRLQLTITNHTHALFACFPGNGAKYNVHYDGGAGDPRKLTAILYVNEGWQAEWDGRLMMYDAGGFSMNGPTEKCWRSITPLAGRLVLFRSDLVLHKVNPAWGRRFALTMFYAARTQAELKSEERKSRASSTGLSKITLK